MNATRRARATAFTLIEAIATIVVVGALSGVTAPLLLAASRAFTRSSDLRSATAAADLAIDRAVRFLREAPEANGQAGVPDITTAQPSRVVFGDGSSLELIGSTLWFATEGLDPAPLCQNVSIFTLSYLGDDGRVLNFQGGDLPAHTHAIAIRLRSSEAELSTIAFLRTRLAG